MIESDPGGGGDAGARAGEAVAELARTFARLRGEGGCPWDRAQTRETLRKYILEEAYEVVEALDGADPARIRDELGDLLFQVVFQSRIAEERGEFDLAGVAAGLREKLVRRHPHVFGDASGRLARPEEVEGRWEELKRAERALLAAKAGGPRDGDEERVSALTGVPKALPALHRAERLQSRASRSGFEWEDVGQALAKLDEERGELLEAVAAGDPAAIEHELGDVLFVLASLGRYLRVGVEDAMRAACNRFESRFRRLEALAREVAGPLPGTPDAEVSPLGKLSPEEILRLWNAAKPPGPAV